ncbi:transposase [Streptomyces sp. STR69]|uniref:transposase n=1 Tax=Streptomyces sp. STR69 TaxID=1796942 RepID=UPI0021C70370|nr:transposase [Streptomyces sp. STR69]
MPVIVADCGYGRSVSFRLALEEYGWSYVMAVEPKEIARPAAAEPHLPPYQGLGPHVTLVTAAQAFLALRRHDPRALTKA